MNKVISLFHFIELVFKDNPNRFLFYYCFLIENYQSKIKVIFEIDNFS